MASVLDSKNEDQIIEQIANGVSQSQIAKTMGVDPGGLSRWLSANEHRSARAREARKISAEAWLDRAEQVLLDLPDDASQTAFAKAKELSQLYRKNAAIRNPAEYGDKVDISGKIDHQHSVSSLLAEIAPTSMLGSSYQSDDAILIEAEPSTK